MQCAVGDGAGVDVVVGEEGEDVGFVPVEGVGEEGAEV